MRAYVDVEPDAHKGWWDWCNRADLAGITASAEKPVLARYLFSRVPLNMSRVPLSAKAAVFRFGLVQIVLPALLHRFDQATADADHKNPADRREDRHQYRKGHR